VNLSTHTCTCLHQARKLRKLAATDPHRLCKHLVATMVESSRFQGFEKFKDEILWFAEHKSSYSSKEKALNKKLYPPKKTPKEPVPPGSIKTVARELTEKPDIGATPFYLWCDPGVYYYVKGEVHEDIIEAIIPEQTGIGLYSINGHQACGYYFEFSASEEVATEGENEEVAVEVTIESEPAPRQYKYLQDALFAWLQEEFARLRRMG
jgi:hypothetical protein